MENIKSSIIHSNRLEVAETIKRIDSHTLEQIFNHKEKGLIEKILNTGIIQANNKIFRTIDTTKLIDTLLGISNNIRWNFLKNISKSQLNQISKFAVNFPEEKILPLIESAPSRNMRIAIISEFPIEKREKYLNHINQIESEIEYLKSKSHYANNDLIAEKTRLIDELSEAIAAKEQLLKDYEKELRVKREILENEINHAQNKLAETLQRTAMEEEHRKQREVEIAKMMAELDEANRKQVQQRIEIKVPEYVTAAVKSLENRESEFKKKARQWGIHGTIVLIIAIIATSLISIYGSGVFDEEKSSEITWQMLVFISFKGLVVLGVLGLWAKHAFSVSNAYMHEAIKRSDRAHAINFGKLYLEIYGNAVDRKELLDIFENWNITSESAFSKVNSDFEPKILEKFSEVVKSIQGNTNK